ncbi:helix-turn-helix domain-containing protein [Candidatus Methylomirabilis sp.]|uniref:helix-turn-helix domain-containing protein n=1 Tax=Candidatus Methylomirabilis sp. TaxID=2032687 RepID=UPI002A660C9F|nr:helix-turn-helix domain-containing protein [Candidatus Methylomirabilis sp.]
MNKHLLRVDEAAMLLSVSRWTIYRWVQEGRLEATKVGKGSLRIFQTSVARLIEQNRIWGIEVSKSHRTPESCRPANNLVSTEYL